MRPDEKMVADPLDPGADPNPPLKTWTPIRRSSRDFHFEPGLVGATPFWMAARFNQPNVMRMLAKHGADPLFVQHSEEVSQRSGFKHRKQSTTPILAPIHIVTVTP